MRCPKCNSKNTGLHDIDGCLENGCIVETWWCDECGCGWDVSCIINEADIKIQNIRQSG